MNGNFNPFKAFIIITKNVLYTSNHVSTDGSHIHADNIILYSDCDTCMHVHVWHFMSMLKCSSLIIFVRGTCINYTGPGAVLFIFLVYMIECMYSKRSNLMFTPLLMQTYPIIIIIMAMNFFAYLNNFIAARLHKSK